MLVLNGKKLQDCHIFIENRSSVSVNNWMTVIRMSELTDLTSDSNLEKLSHTLVRWIKVVVGIFKKHMHACLNLSYVL